METPSTIEDDLEQVLREGEHGFFMRVLIEQLGPRMQAQILRHSRGFLQQADLDEIYSKSLVEIYKAISKPGFDGTRPLRLVNTIIERRTIDACRKATRQKFSTNSDELLGLLAARQSQKGVISAWLALSQDDQDRLMMVVSQSIANKLTPTQKVIAQALVDNLPAFASDGWKSLIQPIFEATGKRYPVSTIRSHWRSARERIYEELAQNGFDLASGNSHVRSNTNRDRRTRHIDSLEPTNIGSEGAAQ